MPERITRYYVEFNVLNDTIGCRFSEHYINETSEENYYCNYTTGSTLRIPKSKLGEVNLSTKGDFTTCRAFYKGTYEETIDKFRVELLEIVGGIRESLRKREHNAGKIYHRLTEVQFARHIDVSQN